MVLEGQRKLSHHEPRVVSACVCMVFPSSKHRITISAYLVGIVVVRRLMGLGGDLGSSPSLLDV